ncbi:uncharacterized protein LOC131434280 [Malaya genurostris]|uniref:uncharacterized protein LOC131434280 n=1 Tax=Malaya genurostris TaxID=325434 RepID=UPI0026F3ECFD|nr:uncharacterized protein LOC131434280 [Malaya genurostris]
MIEDEKAELNHADGEIDNDGSILHDRSLNSREEFEMTYLKLKAFLQSELRKNTCLSDQINVNHVERLPTAPPSQLRVKLPEIKLHFFYGSIKEWPTFRDSFKSVIDSAQQLSNVDKFSYLISSLFKEAKRVVEAIDVTSENYFVAWEMLQRRYENKYLIVKSYVDSLFAVEPMKKECHESLNRLVDEFDRNLMMLEKVGEETESWSTLVMFMLSSRLDPSTIRHWETYRKSTNVPTYDELAEFLRGHSRILQSVATTKIRSVDAHRSTTSTTRNTFHRLNSTLSAISPPQKSCPFCKLTVHSPFNCEMFRKLTATQRFDAAKKNALCINCLSPTHVVKNCSSGTCRVCNQKHHTMLHQRTNMSNSQSNQSSVNKPLAVCSQPSSSSTASMKLSPASQTRSPVQSAENQAPTVSALSTNYLSLPSEIERGKVPSTVLLSTALVKVFNSCGSFLWARALLDSGSQLNFVSEQLIQKLELKRVREFVPISGIGHCSTASKYSTTVRLQSHSTDFEACWKFHVLSRITTELPSQTVDGVQIEWPSEIVLADPSFNQRCPIDLIFGVESFYDILREGQIKTYPNKPVLQNTALGWVVSGRACLAASSSTINLAHICATSSIEEQLSRFWEIESCQIKSNLSVEESACEEHFAKTTTRDPSGRFVVALPKRNSMISRLGNSKEIATHRFLSLERRLNSNSHLKEAYSAFINEYAYLGHMKLIDDSAEAELNYPTYYLPHHCVVRPDSITTKLRVVFDASCATDTGVSLNDSLLVGPLVQDDLFAIVLRFRLPQFAIISDIEKMYRQILVCDADQPLQRILWRDSPMQPIRSYQLTTVTYGTSSAPYLATKTLQKLAEISSEGFPAAANAIRRDFYMDDMLTGVDSVEEGHELYKQLTQVMQSAGFQLRKWASNDPEILEVIPPSLRDERTVFDFHLPVAPIKTLGLQWDTTTDMFLFEAPKHSNQLPITKRVVLSDIARLFDPLGLVGPVVVQAKLFMQELWREGSNWDDSLSDSRQRKWLEFRNDLHALSLMKIPRWVVSTSLAVSLELHGFCDASEKAYGASIYFGQSPHVEAFIQNC